MPRILAAAGAAVFLLSVSPAMPAQRTIVLPEKVNTLIMPSQSTLTFKSFKSNGDPSAEFDGAVVLSGTYYYGDIFESGSGDDPALAIVPDRATRARLPHFKQGDGPQWILLSNEPAFAKAVLSPQAIAAVKKGDTEFVTGKVTVRADGFEAGVSCHDPYISARFVSVEGAATPMKAAALAGGDC